MAAGRHAGQHRHGLLLALPEPPQVPQPGAGQLAPQGLPVASRMGVPQAPCPPGATQVLSSLDFHLLSPALPPGDRARVVRGRWVLTVTGGGGVSGVQAVTVLG